MAKKKPPTSTALTWPRPSGAGRPIEITPEIIDRVCELVEAGCYVETAAVAAGICKSTFYSWLKKGGTARRRLEETPRARPRARELPYLAFLDAVETARAKAETWAVATVTKAAQAGQWTAAAWRLERMYPERWGRVDRPPAESQTEEVAWRQDDPATWSERQLEAYEDTGELPAGPPKADE